MGFLLKLLARSRSIDGGTTYIYYSRHDYMQSYYQGDPIYYTQNKTLSVLYLLSTAITI